MKRRSMLGVLAVASFPSAAAMQSKALLTVSGDIGQINNAATKSWDFSEADFLRLDQSTITTSTSWTPRSVFVGPTLLDVMKVAGVTSGTLSFKTLDDYSAPIPWKDLVRYGVILAHSQNGQRLTSKRWGPLWTIYPRDQYPSELRGPIAETRFIWQVNRIVVTR